MSLLLIFIDGVGIGERDDHNPFAALTEQDRSPLAIFKNEMPPALPFNGRLAITDACLGVPGRPQSATGQTTILTGTNAPALVGSHKPGFPNALMREVLRERNIFSRLNRAGVAPLLFANAYPPQFFAQRPRWLAATTVAVEAAGLPLRTLEDLRQGQALYHDFTNRLLIARGEDADERDADEAAEILARLSAAHRFTLYEYFFTDTVGHKQDPDAARRTLAELNSFLCRTLARIDLAHTTVIVTSDHGNIEDLSTRNHTRNDVPTLVWGKHKNEFRYSITSLADITPAILRALTESGAGGED